MSMVIKEIRSSGSCPCRKALIETWIRKERPEILQCCSEKIYAELKKIAMETIDIYQRNIENGGEITKMGMVLVAVYLPQKRAPPSFQDPELSSKHARCPSPTFGSLSRWRL